MCSNFSDLRHTETKILLLLRRSLVERRDISKTSESLTYLPHLWSHERNIFVGRNQTESISHRIPSGVAFEISYISGPIPPCSTCCIYPFDTVCSSAERGLKARSEDISVAASTYQLVQPNNQPPIFQAATKADKYEDRYPKDIETSLAQTFTPDLPHTLIDTSD